MLQTGKYKGYHFLQILQDGVDFKTFICDFPELLEGKGVAVLSFDGDSMKPTKEEYERGWTYDEQEVAYFKSLNKEELNENIWANCYDEWYLFEEIKKLNSNQIFVTFSGFRLIDLSKSELMKNLQDKFWNQIERNNPNAFIVNGDNFIYGSKNEIEVEQIKKAWR